MPPSPLSGPIDAFAAAVRAPGTALLFGLGVLTGCILEGEDVASRDTVRLVDTVRITDTVVLLEEVNGGAPGAPTGARRNRPSVRDVVPPDSTRPIPVTPGDLQYLTSRRLVVPVAGVPRSKLPDTFDDPRGNRRHNAMDILAPRGTPVLSVDSGRIVKLHTSKGGGLTIYAMDPAERFIYYYAHLDRYRDGVAEGKPLRRGEIIGYVGSTGNATTPHLHFAIARADPDKRWWSGRPVDPLPFLRGGR